MALKTRFEILQDDHNSALAQLIENEIVVKSLEMGALIIQPGKEYDDVQVVIKTKKANIENIKRVIKIIDDMSLEELKGSEGKKENGREG